MALNCEHCANYSANFRRALDLFVGNGRPYPVEVLSELTGIAVKTLYAYKRGESQPSFANVMELIAALPAGFGNMVLAPTGLVGGRKPEDFGDPHAAALHVEVCKLAHSLAKMREDGIIDHIEDAELRPELTNLVEVANGYLATQPKVRKIKGAAE